MHIHTINSDGYASDKSGVVNKDEKYIREW